jgi:MFS family permease
MSPDVPTESTPPVVAPTPHPTIEQPNRISKLKLAFLYVLIGGLAASGLLAIVALLIGSFSTEIQKSLQTIFIFFSHSLLILALLWSDTHDDVGRKVLPTTIFGMTLANIITTTLATWEIISVETGWRAVGFYFLVLGAAFIISGLLKLRIKHAVTYRSIYVTIVLISALVIALAPWVLNVFGDLDPLYFRIVAALAILTSTVFIIAIILRSMALARFTELNATKPAPAPMSNGLLAIYITLGVITAMVWCSGMTGFIVSAVDSNASQYHRYYRN